MGEADSPATLPAGRRSPAAPRPAGGPDHGGRRRRARLAQAARDRCFFVGAGADAVRGVRAGADRPGRPTQRLQLERASARSTTSSASRTTRARCRPVFTDALEHNFMIVVLSILHPAAARPGHRAAAQPQDAGPGVLRTIIFVPYVAGRGDRRRRLAADAAAGRRRSTRCWSAVGLGGPDQLWLGDPDVVLYTVMVVLTWKYVGLAIILFLAGLQGVPRADEAAADRRRALVADPAPDHHPAARPDHPHLGVPVDDRLAPALRHGLDHDRRRPGQRHHDDGDLPDQRGHRAAATATAAPSR